MNDIAILFEIIVYALLIVGPPILVSRYLAGNTGASFGILFRVSTDAPWPRGVQEPEPPRWRPEALRRPATTRNGPASAPGMETARCA